MYDVQRKPAHLKWKKPDAVLFCCFKLVLSASKKTLALQILYYRCKAAVLNRRAFLASSSLTKMLKLSSKRF